MTEAVNVTIDGVEVDANDLETAIEEFSDERDNIDNREGGYGVYGTVAIRGDNYSDGDFRVANTADANSVSEDGLDVDDIADIAWTRVRRAREAIEAAREAQFDAVEYVADIVAGANTVLASDDEDAFNSYGDVEVQYGYITDSEMQDLAADDAITFSKVAAQSDSVGVSVEVDEDAAE